MFLEEDMTQEEKDRYEGPEQLREIMKRTLEGRKFRLDCGHHVTWHHNLGSDVIIFNGKELRIICSLCGY